jgi:hypothetical protein
MLVYQRVPEGRSTKLRIYRPTANGAVGQGTWDAKRVPLIQHKKANVPLICCLQATNIDMVPETVWIGLKEILPGTFVLKPSNTSSPSIDKSSSSQRHTCNLCIFPSTIQFLRHGRFHNVNASVCHVFMCQKLHEYLGIHHWSSARSSQKIFWPQLQ